MRIRDELKLRGVDDGISSACIDARASDWHDEARLALARRFREPGEPNPAERAKRARFLARRGYDSDQIRTVLDCGD